MKTNRTGITRLTTGQCSRITGGDPGMVLAGSWDGGGGGGPGMALAAMGIGYEGGPMAVVTIGPPGDAPMGGFDKWLIGSAGGAAGGAAAAFVGGFVEGAAIGSVAGPIGVAVASLVVGGLAVYAAGAALQHAANNGAYTDGHGMRHAAR